MNYNDKILYLKALCNDKESEKKVTKEIKDCLTLINKGNGFQEFDLVPDKTPKDPFLDALEGKTFVLGHTEDFLHHALEYSMIDKVKDLIDIENNLG